ARYTQPTAIDRPPTTTERDVCGRALKRIAVERKRVCLKPIATGDHAALEQGGALRLKWEVLKKEPTDRRREGKTTQTARRRADAENHMIREDRGKTSVFVACVGA